MEEKKGGPLQVEKYTLIVVDVWRRVWLTPVEK